MKRNLIFLILSSFLCLTSTGAGKTKIGVSSIKTMPFYLDGSITNIQISVSASKIDPVIIEVKVSNDFNIDGVSIYKNVLNSLQTVNIEYDNRYTRPEDNYLIVDEKIGPSVKTYKHYVSLAKSSSVSLTDPVHVYNSVSQNYSYKSGVWTFSVETLKFYNFEDQYVPDFYHKIDPTYFYICPERSYNEDNLMFTGGYFTITNKDGLFNSFNHDSEIAFIPLTLVKKENKYVLAFANNLYVNKTTLEMSSSYKVGFVKTRYFYLPRNEKRYEDFYECGIVLTGLGQDKSNFISKFRYKSLKNIFGDCRNSKYCIINS